MTQIDAVGSSTTGPARSGERGAAVVEFAIIVLPLLLIVFGIFDFGRVYFEQLTMQYASREAARVIALTYDDPGIDLALLDALVDDTLVDLLPVDSASELHDRYMIQIVDGCSGVDTPDDASVRLETNLKFVTPLPDLAGLDQLQSIESRAVMPCEG